MNAPCIDIAQFLSDESALGLTMATNLFYGRFPDNPNECVAVFDNPGDPPMLTLKKETSAYFYSSISVRVRSLEYATGWQQAHNIVEFLHGLSQLNSNDNSTYYAVITAKNDPQVLYWDKNDRVIFFVNFEIQRKPN